jgi:hypothetical protein
LNVRRLGADAHGLIQLAELQGDVAQHDALGGGECDPALLILPESGARDREAVRAGQEIGEDIFARGAGGDLAGMARGVVRERNLGAGNHSAGGIAHAPGDLPGEALGEDGGSSCDENQGAGELRSFARHFRD